MLIWPPELRAHQNNILTTAGTAVLSQANQNNMLALKLLS